ncbi:DUF6002 family protein [Paucibacter sp. B2R-40]|uniref:DUF6002 family protein n=1 Tax=Paucibacter sp. B2R-40 TaxID=2893554 RepID=UPI0021E44FB1|nr:DUF6002 family protein [Paucibacter sp. B2R-40]MCV2353170.1 DUF6002 family protein [Paucibacter sp. B2R-40]
MTTVIDNPISDYYDAICTQLHENVGSKDKNQDVIFSPNFLPELDEQLRGYFSASSISYSSINIGLDIETILINMSRFERTRTTKTNPSLLMVARAIEHTRRTGEAITIVTASSGNKATALRAAVYRAYEFSLATPDTLNIVCVVPVAAESKLWDGPLSSDDLLRAFNPLVTVETSTRDMVKKLVSSAAHRLSPAKSKRRLWFTLALDNYVLADQLRAFIEIDRFPPEAHRWHAHSVSSAFGLIGHSRGWARRWPNAPIRPGYLLVQQLDTPDMVLHLTSGSFDRARLPKYQRSADGQFRQTASPHFPAVTSRPDECIDTTFYTSAPITQQEMEGYIAHNGGTGIVVSRAECERMYDEIRTGLASTDVRLPADLSHLREHSLLMAATGTRLAHARGLLEGVGSVVIHNSGNYADADFSPVPQKHLTRLHQDQVQELDDLIERARGRTFQ